MEPPPPRLCDESPVAESSEPKSGKLRGVTRGTPGGAMPGGFPGHSAARGVGAPSGGKSKAGGAAQGLGTAGNWRRVLCVWRCAGGFGVPIRGAGPKAAR